jgi:hypothetical protein
MFLKTCRSKKLKTGQKIPCQKTKTNRIKEKRWKNEAISLVMVRMKPSTLK